MHLYILIRAFSSKAGLIKEYDFIFYIDLFSLEMPPDYPNGSNTGGSFTVDDSNSFFSPY